MSAEHSNYPRESFSGRTILISGGLGGIGRASVELFVAHGAQVAFTYVNGHESMEAVSALCALAPERISAHALNLLDPTSIQRCMDEAIARWEWIDVLVNNAAVGSSTVSPFAPTSGEQDTAMLTINADGTLKMCLAYIDSVKLRESKRIFKIINLSSVGGGIGVFPHFRLSDGMSKAAVAFLTRQLAAETVHNNIDVFAVCPGATNTGMFQQSTLAGMSEEQRRAFLDTLPKRRLIEPSEIANIILFLASERARVLHGAVIDASMGLGVRPGLITEH